MGGVRVRVRHPEGTLQVQAEDSWTAGQFIEHLRKETGVPCFVLKSGFPPAVVDLSDKNISLGALNLNGSAITLTPIEDTSPEAVRSREMAKLVERDSLMAAELAAAESTATPSSGQSDPKRPDNLSVPWPEMDDGYMVLRVMADDNSCLFTALSAALVPQVRDPAPFLRNQIAEYILSHRDTYNRATLEKSPEDYVANLRGRDFWGGSIEMSVLSAIYDIQIVAVDVKTLEVFPHGEDKTERCLVLYSGIHYDRIVLAPGPDYPHETDIVRFDIGNDSALKRARVLAERLQRSGYYTDTNTIVIQCMVPGCNWLGDVKGANEHSNKTGHQSFEQIEDK
ncbi:uncharacterized protein PgNI_00490 [Pyricularia grisea]|uniref:Ubiquitin thioesterase OTU n=1 Tax=Pyricularia grisea TaxID=148305 RepID=A0A6P8BLF3_PYRGI|nr:uncharacterized protein PgNI_00490 [Pyricularia grisea]TLD17485.1 hypothetical protein PgNI_00490 [Pyricularia grisea]